MVLSNLFYFPNCKGCQDGQDLPSFQPDFIPVKPFVSYQGFGGESSMAPSLATLRDDDETWKRGGLVGFNRFTTQSWANVVSLVSKYCGISTLKGSKR